MKTNLNYNPAFKAGVNIAVLGASGYTGLETIRILLKHPKVKIKVLIGEKTKGKTLGEICSPFSDIELPKIVSLQEASFKGIDVIFSCMPSGRLSSIVDMLPENLIIIDLSADLELKI
jgi:N-acetyl-gamma-glutamyl-phosphate reductase